MTNNFSTGSTSNVQGKPLKVMSSVQSFSTNAYCTLLLMNDGSYLACGSGARIIEKDSGTVIGFTKVPFAVGLKNSST